MNVLQVAVNVPGVRPTLTVKHKQNPKQHRITDFNAINSSGDDDDMLRCIHCKLLFHSSREFWFHMEKCDK